MSREDGKPITDGRRLAEGMFVPVGDYKGSGLALVLGLLGGPLNRAAFGRDVKDTNSEQARESNAGQFIIALDVARFLPLELSRPRSTATCATSPVRSGFRASTKSACRARAVWRAAPSGSRTACRCRRRC